MGKASDKHSCGFDEEREMEILEKISSMTVQRKKVSEIISTTLELLWQTMFIRATMTLRNGDYLFIEDAKGLDREEIKKGVYKIGEGLTGKAAALGHSIVEPDISKCKDFLNRTGSHTEPLENISFLCAPIIYMEQVIGTISAERKNADKKRLAADIELLETISNIIADSVALLYMRKEESNKLRAEYRRGDAIFETNRPASMVGNCGAMQNVYDFILKASKTSECVFIRGKSGTGKELAARAIAEASQDCREIKILNCAGLPSKSAALWHIGLEKPQTIFFDEAAALSPEVQRELSKAIETGKFVKLGQNTPTNLKARAIFASSLDVEKLVESGAFDKSFYRTISKNCVHIPSLKDRKSDIMLLAEHFLEKFNAAHGKHIKRISTPAINMMSIYSWPGNVRELENCMERAVISSNDSAISGYNLPPAVRSAAYSQRSLPYGEDIDFESMVESFERELITEALKFSRGNAADAARKLGLTQRIINYKIKRYAIVPSWYKNTK